MKLSKLWLEALHAVANPSYVSRPLGPVGLLGIGADGQVGETLSDRPSATHAGMEVRDRAIGE